MERIATPLRSMGARIETDDGHLPVTITGAPPTPIDYERPSQRAQVKSAVLPPPSAQADGRRSSSRVTRDHTELMLREAGVRVTARPTSVASTRREPSASTRSMCLDDFSSAAPFIVAARSCRSRALRSTIGLNPRRTVSPPSSAAWARASAFSPRAPVRPGAGRRSRSSPSELTATEIEAHEVPP